MPVKNRDTKATLINTDFIINYLKRLTILRVWYKLMYKMGVFCFEHTLFRQDVYDGTIIFIFKDFSQSPRQICAHFIKKENKDE